MNNSTFKLSIFTFTCIFLKRLIFPNWEFQSVDFNSIELLGLLVSFGFSLYYWIKIATNKALIKRISAILSLLLCSVIIYQNTSLKNEIIGRIELNEKEEILIEQLHPSICAGELEYCTDSVKVTKYKIFQKRESI